MRRAKKLGIYHRVLGVIVSLCAQINLYRGGGPWKRRRKSTDKGKEVKGKLEKKKEEYYNGKEVKGEK